MDRYEKIDPIYKYSKATIVISVVLLVFVSFLVAAQISIIVQLQACTAESCFGINLLQLVPDYSKNIASIADELRQQQRADSQSLAKQLFDVYQQLLVIQATLDRFKAILPT